MELEKKLENKPLEMQRTFLPVSLQSLYSNGILVSLTVSDISLTITINGQPTHTLNMSLTTAKTLAANINTAIKDFEEKTGSKVLEAKEVATFMKPNK